MAKMSLKRLTTPGAYSIGSALTFQGFAMLTFVLLARTLPFGTMGAWALWLTLTAIGDSTRHGFIQNGLVRFNAIEPAGWGKWLTAALALNAIASAGLGLVLIAAALLLGLWFNMPEFSLLALWVFPVVVLQGAGKLAEAIQVAKKDFRGIFWANTINGGLQFCLTAWCFWKNMPLGIEQLISFQAVGISGGLVAALFFCKKSLHFEKLEKGRLSELFRFGKYVAGTNFFSMLFQRLDTLLIGAFLTPAAIAIYNVATRLNSLLDLPLNGLSLTQYPKLAEAHAQSGDIQPTFEQSVRQLVSVQAPLSILMVVTAPWAVRLLAGKAYMEAVPLLQLLAVAGLVKPWGRTFGLALDAAGKSDINFKMLLLSLGINLALNLCLIPFWGITGAALATSLGIIVTTAIGQQFLRPILDVKPWTGFNRRLFSFGN